MSVELSSASDAGRTHSLAVRELAQWVFRQGDLYPARAARGVDAELGIKAQQSVQQQRSQDCSDYSFEVPVAVELACVLHAPWLPEYGRISGRIDGLYRGVDLRVQEYKTCRAFPEQTSSVDTAQAMLYAALLAESEELPDQVCIGYEVVYLVVEDTRIREKSFTHQATAASLRAWLRFTLVLLQARLDQHAARVAYRQAWSDTLDFPMKAFRRGQAGLSRRVYQALIRDNPLLIEAPTGSGKSLGVLYPAVRLLQAQRQALFLTSRGAGARAAIQALTQLDPQTAHLAYVEITAKEKVCPVEGMPCRADECSYAAGYFDRAGTAVQALLDKKAGTRVQVLEVAEQHHVCPFELSLDTAIWADVVVADYNYVFDPAVRLKRFTGRPYTHVLIDEAHQVAPRLQDMLSVTLSREDLSWPRQDKSAFGRRVRAIDRALMKLRKSLGEGEHTHVDLEALRRAVQRLLDIGQALDDDLFAQPELQNVLFACARYKRAEKWWDDADCVSLVRVDGRTVSVKLMCLDVARYCRQVLGEYGSSVRFSGTVSPLKLYQRLHGFSADYAEQAERVESPFAASQSVVLIIDDVPTYYRQRAQSAPVVARTITTLAAAKAGHYVVAFPSYAYLAQIRELIDAPHTVYAQTSGMDASAISALLEQFEQADSALLFIVLGGSLSESVDFTGIQLSGVAVVGLGLPPPSTERDLQAAHFEGQHDADGHPISGQVIAYTQPALVKILQAAGRLVRSTEDRGIVCLIDQRFRSPWARQFFPQHWHGQTKVIKALELAEEAERFWTAGTAQ